MQYTNGVLLAWTRLPQHSVVDGHETDKRLSLHQNGFKKQLVETYPSYVNGLMGIE